MKTLTKLAAGLCLFTASLPLFAGEIVQETEELIPYYTAVSQIRKGLESAISTVSPSFVQNGFEGWPSPNPFYYRTPKFMFLETSLFTRDGSEQIHSLYTPFGEVKVLGGGIGNELLEVSAEMLKSMDWELVDLTSKVNIYNYIQDEDKRYGPFKPKKETWEGAGTPTKIYLVKRVGELDFSLGMEEELAFFCGISLAKGQCEQDKVQFKELSGESEKF